MFLTLSIFPLFIKVPGWGLLKNMISDLLIFKFEKFNNFRSVHYYFSLESTIFNKMYYSRNLADRFFYNFYDHCRTIWCVDSASLSKNNDIEFEKFNHFRPVHSNQLSSVKSIIHEIFFWTGFILAVIFWI